MTKLQALSFSLQEVRREVLVSAKLTGATAGDGAWRPPCRRGEDARAVALRHQDRVVGRADHGRDLERLGGEARPIRAPA